MKKVLMALFLFLYGCIVMPILFIFFIPAHFFECVAYVKEFEFVKDAKTFFNLIIDFLATPLNELE